MPRFVHSIGAWLPAVLFCALVVFTAERGQAAGSPHLVGTMTATGDLHEGGTFTYHVQLANVGTAVQPDDAGSEFTDHLPAGLIVTHLSADLGTISFFINDVTWNGSLEPGDKIDLAIECKLGPGTAGKKIQNQGTLAYDGSPSGTKAAGGLTDDPALPGAADPTSFVALPAAVASVPTLSFAGLAGLALVLALAAALRLRRP
jgi:hypothetical protein